MNEYELIARLEQHDPDALAFLYREYQPRVAAVVRRLIRDEWDVEYKAQFTIIRKKPEAEKAGE